MKLPENTKAYAWGAVFGAVALAIVGFSWGGWMTGGTATKHATTTANEAVVAALAPICVMNFRAQTDAAAKTADLVKASSWERGTTIEKSGFATMPGSTTVNTDVARACAEMLAAPAKT
jgi:hypothetical protein